MSMTSVPQCEDITMRLYLPFQFVEDTEWLDLASSVVHSPYDSRRRQLLMNPRKVEVMKELRRQKRGYLQFKALGTLLEVPHEILLEVFSHLHPVDLYHLSRTQKLFRDILLSFSSKWIWVAAFSIYPDIPSCPTDMPYPKWTDLLFGDLECQDCGAPGAQPIFVWRRRLCDSACAENRILRHFEEITGSPIPAFQEKLIVHLNWVPSPPSQYNFKTIPHWKREHNAVQRIADGKAFETRILNMTLWSADAPAIKAQFFGKGVEIRDSDAATLKVLEEFEATYQETYSWNGMIFWRHALDKFRYPINLLQRRLGFPEETIKTMMRDHSNSPIIVAITKRKHDRWLRQEWRTIKPQVDSLICQTLKHQSKQAEMKANLRRWDLISTVVSDYIDSLPPQTRVNLPAKTTIQLYQPFPSMKDRSQYPNLSGKDVTEAIKSFVDRWPPIYFEDLLSFLPSIRIIPSLSKVPGLHNLDSASFIFRCPAKGSNSFDADAQHDDYAFGWQTALTHIQSCSAGIVEIDERGCTAAVAILQGLNLHLCMTLPSEVDQWRGRFICTECLDDESSSSESHRAKAMTWREYVKHYIQFRKHSTPQWRILSEEETSLEEGNELDDVIMLGIF